MGVESSKNQKKIKIKINTFIIFQTYINKILTKFSKNCYVIYLNNILIFFVNKINHVIY